MRGVNIIPHPSWGGEHVMRHLDLFSGIAGFAVAIDRVFGKSEHIFCEIDPFCQAILRKRFKGSIIYGDIRQLNSNPHRDRLQKSGAELTAEGDRQLSEAASNPKSGKPGLAETGDGREDTRGRDKKRIDILTGGFPCQPFSQAGKRRGTSDDRFLWPAMLRVIRDFKPTWVVAENVRGLLTINEGLVFEQVCLDLENEGYEVQAFIIPACAVNAPHRRDRVWIIAHAGHGDGQRAENREEFEGSVPNKKDAVKSERPDSDEGKEPISDTASVRRNDWKRNRQGGHIQNTTIRKNEKNKQERDRRIGGAGKRDNDASYPKCVRLHTTQDVEKLESKGCDKLCAEQSGDIPAADSESARLKSRLNGQRQKQFWGGGTGQDWFEVATRLCRMDDGLPARVDGLELSKSRHRIERLKALGNSIVPQVAIEIFKAIKSAEEVNAAKPKRR